MSTSPAFVPGLQLAELFFREAVHPVLQQEFPGLKFSAALIGSGSEILSFDDEMSSDHHWGPRVMLFVRDTDSLLGAAIKTSLSTRLPRRFKDWPTSFTAPIEEGQVTQLLDFRNEGSINHRVEILTVSGFFWDYLGVDIKIPMKAADWLSLPEQKLRTIVGGRVFHDGIGLEAERQKFNYYPQDVWLYILAACWMRIEQEGHLTGRAGIAGDEIGSSIIASRLVRDLMRLSFLMEKEYAPYSKWFGTAFARLSCAKALLPHLGNILAARNWQARQEHLTKAYEHVAAAHNSLGITAPMLIEVAQFHDRPFLVISQGEFSSAIRSAIKDPEVKAIASRRLIGNIDLVTDNTDLLEDKQRRPVLKLLYE